MKKILVFSPYYPPHVGGLESHAAEFNEKISREGYQVTVFTPNLPKNNERNEEITLVDDGNAIRIIRYPAFELIPNYPLPRFWKRLFYRQLILLKKENFTVIISRTRFFVSTLMAMVFAKAFGKQWLHIEHGSDFSKMKSKILDFVAWSYDCIFGRLVFIFADSVVCNSQATADFAKMLYGNRKYFVIHRGVNEEMIAGIKAFEKSKMDYEGKIVVSYLGRLMIGKGVSDLLHAVANLDKLPLVCWIIGSGPEKENLERLTRELNISDKVVFWGNNLFRDAIALLKSSDIFVNPSYTEGMPTAVIEAALCSMPIIATDVGGTKEILSNKKEIIFIAPHEIEKISRAIKELTMNISLRKEMGDNAYKVVSGKFSWKKSIAQYKDILGKMDNGGVEKNTSTNF